MVLYRTPYLGMMSFLIHKWPTSYYIASFNIEPDSIYEPKTTFLRKWLEQHYGISARDSAKCRVHAIIPNQPDYFIAGFIISEDDSNFLKLLSPPSLIETSTIQEFLDRIENVIPV